MGVEGLSERDYPTQGLSERDYPTLYRTVVLNPFVPTVAFSQLSSNIWNLNLLRDDNAQRALSFLRGLRGAPSVLPLCRETANVERNGGHKWV